MTDSSFQETSEGNVSSETCKPSEMFSQKRNLLTGSEIDYSELPLSFEAGNELLDAAALLRHKTEVEKHEIGGILTKDQKGKIRFTEIGKGTPWSISLKVLEITNENFKLFAKNIINNHEKIPLVLTSKEFANDNPEYFKSLIDVGVEVLLDRVPVGKLHSHPSDSLPSPHDFSQILFEPGLFTQNNIPEIVVAPEYVYLLFPTKQTKYLSDDELSKNGTGIIWEWEGTIEDNLKHLNEIDETNSVKSQDNEIHANGLLYQFLKTHCPERNVGFYALKKGESVAQRVF